MATYLAPDQEDGPMDYGWIRCVPVLRRLARRMGTGHTGR